MQRMHAKGSPRVAGVRSRGVRRELREQGRGQRGVHERRLQRGGVHDETWRNGVHALPCHVRGPRNKISNSHRRHHEWTEPRAVFLKCPSALCRRVIMIACSLHTNAIQTGVHVLGDLMTALGARPSADRPAPPRSRPRARPRGAPPPRPSPPPGGAAPSAGAAASGPGVVESTRSYCHVQFRVLGCVQRSGTA